MNKRGVFAYVLQLMLFFSVFALCLFLSAGRLDWTAGWIFLGVTAAGQIVTAAILTVKNPELMAERASIGKRDLDRVLAGIMALFGPAAICILGGLGLRNGWQPEIHPALQIAGIVVAASGAALTIWAMAANRFFYGVMRIAREQGHSVCDTGPYQSIRHPGYMGAILFDLAAPLVLRSAWAFIPALITVIVIIIRTAREDKALRAGLDGYREYAGRIKFRLLPGVW